ncbi:MAG TPA: NAD(P)H-quinone oxidoreductase [Kofleriaceae bacterium]|jgi:putative PIG3 family NAD(P)H quinone oxidoreductase
MRAVVISKPGGPEVLVVVERPRPEPQRGEVRVRVHATAINRADVLQRMGHYPAPADAPADIPGLELAGEVDAVGEGVTRLVKGDRVFGLVGGGSYAEYAVTHERALAKIPDGIAYEHAAAVPEAFITAHDAIVGQAGLTAGETLLIHAVGSGVGTAATQLGAAIGAFVIGTARTADKLERAKPLGLDAGILVENGKFADAVKAIDPEGAHVVLELVGGPYVDEDMKATRTKGRIVLVGLLAGMRAELDLGRLLRGRQRIFGTQLRSRSLEEKLAVMRTFEEQVVPLLARGKIVPVIDEVMSLDQAAAAHKRMQSNEGFGKIVLRV